MLTVMVTVMVMMMVMLSLLPPRSSRPRGKAQHSEGNRQGRDSCCRSATLDLEWAHYSQDPAHLGSRSLFQALPAVVLGTLAVVRPRCRACSEWGVMWLGKACRLLLASREGCTAGRAVRRSVGAMGPHCTFTARGGSDGAIVRATTVLQGVQSTRSSDALRPHCTVSVRRGSNG
jgi:hypothetical protein